MKVLLVVLGVLVLAVVAAVLYFVCSPMPVVRLLRRKMDDSPSYPDGYGKIRERVEIHRDLDYPSRYGNHTYDLYLPKSVGKDADLAGKPNPAEKAFPLILWVHGGAFVAGDKAGVENWGVMLAGKGYAVAAMNYCLAPEAAYPAQIQQIGECLAAILKLAEGKQIDMGRVGLSGDSAGAYMAAQFAVASTNDALAGQIAVSSPLAGGALKCALLFCGPYDVRRMFNVENRTLRLFISRIGWSFLGRKKWSEAPLISTVAPKDFVTERMVPCYITDGNAVSFEPQGRALGEALRGRGVKVKERYFAKEDYGEVPHEYQMRLETKNAMDCFGDVLDFLEECM
jgi:acetyl esterase/lipase